ncbi:hypothetical protein IT084_04005 [Desulfallas sp. Bu1-1]|uniref:PilN domain-containing protein n=1 Tax=Desulfallas sp. Bu1-1 TaxID=2787620 RepID=UPI00189CBE35|nr:hypothetical protein [Desulfallas sp. Bu1-1]MBF7082140.1 hypothetical protein [Desulfallas sp. Bu1-1]
MPVSINLLPPEILARQEQQRRMHLLLVACALVLAIVAGAYSALTINTIKARAEVARLQREREALESKIQSLEQYAGIQDQVTRTGSLVRRAVGTPPDWARVLAGIGLDMPVNIWLTDLSATYKVDESNKAPAGQGGDNPRESSEGQQQLLNEPAQSSPDTSAGELVIRGWAFDHLAVAQWLKDLQRVPGLADIRCQFSSEENLLEQPMIQFEIKAALLPGPAYHPVGRKGG